ncbi:MAG: efflux RND transporter permease subunit [Chloroflexota bacterium]|nr:efflux RND transporter permease subunit [Dehalococcoidia bacterium]MDW8253491.1 efflux RND transporter permease subunit [Chloroflexota bacterium]
MGLTRVAIFRPVFMSMVILGLALLGAISFRGLNAELYPTVSSPFVTIVTAYPGAAPEDVERLVTKPIEDAVAGISNIDYIQSTSAEGQSIVLVAFNDRAREDLVAVEVERRVGAARGQLPNEALAPVVSKFDFTATPIYFLAVTGDRPLEEIYRIADTDIRPRLEALDGVAQVALSGGLAREIHVVVDPVKLAAYNLTYDQIIAALARDNQSRPGGALSDGDRSLNIRLSGLFQTTDQLGQLVIANPGTGPILLRDVATVQQATKKVTTIARFNGKPAVAITVNKNATANEVQTADNIRRAVTTINRSLPAGVQVVEVFDRSAFTRNSLYGVQRALIEAIIITGLVLLVFLHTLRSTTIVLFAIPTSLLTTFLWMAILGFTLNIMSTLALVLVIGVLVDDSIVVIENIVRHLELGENPFQAALNGRSEIGLAAIAITLVDVVIFLPVAFLSGITGSFFRQFGLVIVAAVLTSLFISFTLTPMLSSRWLNQKALRIGGGPWGWFVRGWNAMFDTIERNYQRSLHWLLTKRYQPPLPGGRFLGTIFAARWIPPLVGAASLVLAFSLIPLGFVKFEFIPQSDDSFIQVDVELPPGSSLQATEAVLRKIEAELDQIPEVEQYLSTAGSGGTIGFLATGSNTRTGQIFVRLHPLHERKRSVFEIIEELKPKVRGIDGAIVNVTNGGGFSGQYPIVVRVQGQDRAEVERVAAQVEQIVRSIPGVDTVRNSSSLGNPEYRLVVDRDRLADARLTADQVASALRTTVEGTVATKFRPTGGSEQDVRVIANVGARGSLSGIEAVPITVLRDGQPVQVRIGQVTRVEEVAGPAAITRRNRVPQATIQASLVGQTPLNDVTNPLEARLAELRRTLPDGITVAQGGEAEEQAEAFTQLLFALALSIVLIYMLLAALYESVVMPFATMFALPVATVGAFLGLAITGLTLNLLSLIGMIVLMGLVGKNGILLVDYTNTLRQRGRSRLEAILEAGPTRLRPILMTSAALVFGLLPIAIGAEEGGQLYRSIGALIIGGMITSTFLSLYVVPSMYTFFDDMHGGLRRLASWRPFQRRLALPAQEGVPAPVPSGVRLTTVDDLA